MICAFKNPILNRIWQLLPGVILWKIWKEHNRRIFLSTKQTWGEVWLQIRKNIVETILATTWTKEDLSCDSNEKVNPPRLESSNNPLISSSQWELQP
jgi:hypothetical protein